MAAEILAPIRDKLDAIRVPAFGLFPSPSVTPNRLGGMPLVPDGFVWPRKNGSPHSFLAQLDLATLGDERLPKEGTLCFFCNFDHGCGGYEPQNRGDAVVLYFRDSQGPFRLSEPPSDLSKTVIFKQNFVVPKLILVFPSHEAVVGRLGMTEEQSEAYWEMLDTEFGSHPMHQVLGAPHPVQSDDMEEQCQLVSNGINLGSGNPKQDAPYEELMRDHRQWRLLLQLDSSNETGFYLGDGMLYFWIKEDDLANCKFDDVWVIFQYT